MSIEIDHHALSWQRTSDALGGPALPSPAVPRLVQIPDREELVSAPWMGLHHRIEPGEGIS
ncbi:hypothetical protein GCM10017710_25070 [Arthrobacter ramosus]